MDISMLRSDDQRYLGFCNRNYNPGVGRFMSEDPIGFRSGDTNHYRYVKNSPLMLIDPSGLAWVYCQNTGRLYHKDDDGNESPGLGGVGYSGAPGHINNPSSQFLQNLGPIPAGVYSISGPRDSDNTGPHVLDLTPDMGTNTGNRSSFQIHGESNDGIPGNSSKGCVIQPRNIREQVSKSGDTTLEVVTCD